jgi:hypothetical protein
VIYYRAWYRNENDTGLLNPEYPDWIVYAMDEEQARTKVLESMGRHQPEKGLTVFLSAIPDEDEGTVAFASARQNGQALM